MATPYNAHIPATQNCSNWKPLFALQFDNDHLWRTDCYTYLQVILCKFIDRILGKQPCQNLYWSKLSEVPDPYWLIFPCLMSVSLCKNCTDKNYFMLSPLDLIFNKEQFKSMIPNCPGQKRLKLGWGPFLALSSPAARKTNTNVKSTKLFFIAAVLLA